MKFTYLFFLFALTAHADPSSVKFSYSPNEGEGTLTCTQKQLRPWDWDVECGEGKKKFFAHLVVSEMHRQEKPQTYLEIIYHVMAHGEDGGFTSQATWIFLNDRATTHHLVLSQGVENGQASLVVEADFELRTAR